jgi:hypothetical protein
MPNILKINKFAPVLLIRGRQELHDFRENGTIPHCLVPAQTSTYDRKKSEIEPLHLVMFIENLLL